MLALAALVSALSAPASPATTREPLPDALAAARAPIHPVDSPVRLRPAALRSMVRGTAERFASAGYEFQISSDHFGPAEIESVAGVLRSLDHGPELAELSVFVATPVEIGEICGEAVLACYFPSAGEIVVSGVDRPVEGVPREFAIAHEYGHHIANTQTGGALPAIEGSTLRWATYERVCQLTRRGRLFPGDQGAHYWQNPEEAFAQAYARLNRPDARVGWQYTPLLRPTAAALAKIHADIARPRTGPVETSWGAAVSAPPSESRFPAGVRSDAVGIDGARVVGDPPWLVSRLIRTPLDGPVTVSLRAPAGADLSLSLRDPVTGRALARATTGPDGNARLSSRNCGHDALGLEVRASDGPASFRVQIARP